MFDQTTEQSNEGPSLSGGIVRSVGPVSLAEQSSEGPDPRPGGIAGSAASKRGVKRKLDAKSLETKYEVLMEVEKRLHVHVCIHMYARP